MKVLSRVVTFLTCTDAGKTRDFFETILGFPFVADDGFALVFDLHGTPLRIAKAESFTPIIGTVLGWEVDDIRSAIQELKTRGIVFEQFNLPFLQQDADGVWTAPDGDLVAWFRDPAGNTLSLSQHASKPAN